MVTKALEHRGRIKARKPRFLRQDSHKRAKFRPASWRRPKGLHSKMRLGKKSYARGVEVGWSSPREARGLHRSGLRPVVVATLADLEKLDYKIEGAVLSASLGARKRELLLKRAKEKGVTVLNFKVDDALKKISEGFVARKREHASKLTEKQKKELEKKKTVEERVEEPQEKSEEEKEKAFKEEKQKVLTKKS